MTTTATCGRPAAWPLIKRRIVDTLSLVDADLPDVLVATAMSTIIPGDPIWIYVSGASGSGKTECVRLLSGPIIKQYTAFTAASLISGYVSYDKETGQKRQSSFLAELDNHVLVIRDASQILSMPRDQLVKMLGVFRDAFDGSCIQRFGSHIGDVRVDCHFTIIAATTQQVEYMFEQTDRALGERFLTWKPILMDSESHIRHAISMAGRMDRKRTEIQNMVADFMNENSMPRELDEIECDVEYLAEIANFTATARSPIVRNKYRHDTVEAPPEIECGARIGKQLLKLGKASFWLGGNHQRIVKRMSLSTIPKTRVDILREVYRMNITTIQGLVGNIRVSERMIRQEADNLHYLGILDRRLLGRTSEEDERRGRIPYSYMVNPRWAHTLDVMMSDRWMALSPEEQEAQRLAEEERERRRNEARRGTIRGLNGDGRRGDDDDDDDDGNDDEGSGGNDDDYWPGEE